MLYFLIQQNSVPRYGFCLQIMLLYNILCVNLGFSLNSYHWDQSSKTGRQLDRCPSTAAGNIMWDVRKDYCLLWQPRSLQVRALIYPLKYVAQLERWFGFAISWENKIAVKETSFVRLLLLVKPIQYLVIEVSSSLHADFSDQSLCAG